jgi:hypothetical protein
MSSNSISLQDTDENIEALRHLKEGDSIYTCEYEYTPEKGGSVHVEEFKFRRYVEPKKNQTDVKVVEEDVIPAMLYLPNAPSIDVPQDISTSFYMTPRAAVQSFRDGVAQVVSDCDAWLISDR